MITREELRELLRDDLEAALSRQNIALKELFDARLATVVATHVNLEGRIGRHETKISALENAVNAIKTALALTRLKVAGIVAAAVVIASAVATFVTKHFLSIVVTR